MLIMLMLYVLLIGVYCFGYFIDTTFAVYLFYGYCFVDLLFWYVACWVCVRFNSVVISVGFVWVVLFKWLIALWF